MTAAVISQGETLEALQALRQELGTPDQVDLSFADSAHVPIAAASHVLHSIGCPRRASLHDDRRDMTATVISNDGNLEAVQALRQEFGSPDPVDRFASSTDVPIAAPSHVLHGNGSPARTSFVDGAWPPASGRRDMTAAVISREESSEALQALRRKLRSPGPVEVLFAVPDSAAVVVAAPARARLHSTTTLRRGTFRDTAIRRSEPPEAAP